MKVGGAVQRACGRRMRAALAKTDRCAAMRKPWELPLMIA